MIQYEVAKIALPPLPSALTIAGPVPTTVGFPNSDPFTINGNDRFNVGSPNPFDPTCGNQNKPAVGTVQDVGNGTLTPTQVATQSQNNVINALPRPDHYTGSDACTGGQPDVQNVQNTANTLFTTVDGLNSVVQNIKNAATTTWGDNPSIPGPDFGTPANYSATPPVPAVPKITVVNGDLTFGPGTGAGILLVTGTLNMHGNFNFDGVILVIGAGHVIFSGGGGGQINGAMVVANIGQTSGCASGTANCYPKNPTDGNLNNPKQLGTPIFDWAGGGGNSIRFDSCTIANVGGAANFTVIARREITY